MDDGTIIQNFNHRCNGNTIYILVIFLRVVPICATNTTTKYKIVYLSLVLHPQNYIGNHMSLYMNMDDKTIFQYSIKRMATQSIV